MSGLWPLPTVQSFVPSISLLPGESTISPTTVCTGQPHPSPSEHLHLCFFQGSLLNVQFQNYLHIPYYYQMAIGAILFIQQTWLLFWEIFPKLVEIVELELTLLRFTAATQSNKL